MSQQGPQKWNPRKQSKKQGQTAKPSRYNWNDSPYSVSPDSLIPSRQMLASNPRPLTQRYSQADGFRRGEIVKAYFPYQENGALRGKDFVSGKQLQWKARPSVVWGTDRDGVYLAMITSSDRTGTQWDKGEVKVAKSAGNKLGHDSMIRADRIEYVTWDKIRDRPGAQLTAQEIAGMQAKAKSTIGSEKEIKRIAKGRYDSMLENVSDYVESEIKRESENLAKTGSIGRVFGLQVHGGGGASRKSMGGSGG